MIDDPVFYLAAIPAMILLGLAKGGLSGAGSVSLPLLALVMSPIQAAGMMLPVLIASDLVAVYAYRRSFDGRSLAILVPAAIVGTALGWATAAWVTADVVRLVVGVISVVFALDYWLGLAARRKTAEANAIKGSFWGAIAGYTSFVSHAGGPPLQMYLVPLRLDRRVFAGTAVIFFAIINIAKIVPYFFLGQLAPTNLLLSAILAPITIVSALVGVRIVHLISQTAFYRVIFALILVVGVKLIWDGAGALL